MKLMLVLTLFISSTLASAKAPRLIVISGGPATGKSTLLQELAKRGYPIVLESATEVIKERGIDVHKTQGLLDELIVERQPQAEALAIKAATERGAHYVFLDRSVIDPKGYQAYYKGSPTPRFTAAFNAHMQKADRYHRSVFITEALPEAVLQRTNGVRIEGREQSLALGSAVEQAYLQHGYKTLRISAEVSTAAGHKRVLTPSERADMVLAHLAQNLEN